MKPYSDRGYVHPRVSGAAVSSVTLVFLDSQGKKQVTSASQLIGTDRPSRLSAPQNEILAGRPVPVVGRGHSIRRRGRRGAPEPRGGVASLVWGSCTRRRRARGAEFYPAIRGSPLASEIGLCKYRRSNKALYMTYL